MKKETLNLILLLTPLIIGGIIAAVNAEAVNDTTEKAEEWTRKTQKSTSRKEGWLSRYITNPILWIIVKFCDWTDNFIHRGLKNGARVAATLYLIAVVVYLLVALFVIFVALAIGAIVLYVVFKVLINSNDDVRQGYEKGVNAFQNTNQRQHDIPDMVGIRGQKIYSGTNWLNEELKGRVDDEGNIYSGTNWFSEEKIGRIDKEGTIYKGTSFFQ
jgi:hypothetical protein